MAEYLFIRFAADQSSAIVLNGEGRITRAPQIAPLASLATLAPQRRVIVMVPGTDVITTHANVPPANAARLRQLLPFSLEDAFAEDVERLLFAPGQRLASGELCVSVVARQQLEQWLADLREAGLQADAIVAETDGVPDTPATLNLILEGARVYGRRSGEAPFMLEGLDLASILDIVAGKDDASLRHAVVLADLAGQQYHARGLAELHERLGSIDIKQLPDGAFPHLAAALTVSAGTNLLQGPYARKSNWRALAQPWYAAAGLLAATLALLIVGQAAEYFALQREDRALTELVTARCQQAFAANRISSCTTAVQRSLSEAGAASSAASESFLTTLSAVAESYSGNGRIEALSYRNNVMDLQVLVSDVPALDAFAQQITGTDRFDVRIQSANPGDNGVEGRLQVTGANQ